MDKYFMNLHLFDDGAEGGGESADAEQNQVDNAQVDNAQVDNAQTETEPKRPSFDELIKDAEYKKEYDARVQSIIKERLKNSKALEQQLNKLNPMVETLAKRYGVEASDVDKLMTLLEEDSKSIEEEALKKGISTDQYRESLRLERQNAELQRQIKMQQDEVERQQFNARIAAQVDEAKQYYPNFDLPSEAMNEDFAKLLRAGISVKMAYETVHHDELQVGAMAKTAQTVAEKLSNTVQAGKNRPVENGIKSNAGISTKIDISNLTPDKIRKIDQFVARGNKVDLSNPSAELIAYLKA